ncbi:Glycosyl transferase family 2 [Phycisphaerae bacterium RAS2]|nr:Glycosyl transferase family 2 [Phycisphaerae bacterium RAS2]
MNTHAPLLDIVIASYNRLSHLQGAIEAVRATVAAPHRLIVVDGDSPDGTSNWCMAHRDIHLIREERREGATRAYNKGFRAATAPFVMWLNDDARPLPGAVDAALAMFGRADLFDLGMVAFYHNERRPWNKLDTVIHDGAAYSIYNVRGWPYANFGLLPTGLMGRLGFLDERYRFCAWDPDLSLKVQREAGLRVLGCRGALIHHDELHDERKVADLAVIDADNAKLFEKWKLPPKNSYADPAPAYQHLARALAL